MAAKVSPVEAAKYTEGMTGKKKKRHSRGAKVYQMAFANLGRNKKKTILVVVSLTLSVTLLNVLFSLVNGFDMDKYVDRSTCADFIVSSTDYFRYNTADEYIGADTIDEIKENTDETVSGSGYDLADISPMMWMETDQYSKLAENYLSGKELQEEISHYEQKGDSILVDVSIEGFDDGLFDKLTVVKGSLEPLSDPDSHAIAVAVSTDDYGNIVNLDNYPELGDTYTVNYQIGYDIDSRTGERADQQTTPEEYLEYHEEEAKEVEYSVCALVTVPDSISFRYTSLGYSMVLPLAGMVKHSRNQPAQQEKYWYNQDYRHNGKMVCYKPEHSTIFSDGYTTVSSNNFYVEIRITNTISDLIVCSSCYKHCKTCNKWNFPFGC